MLNAVSLNMEMYIGKYSPTYYYNTKFMLVVKIEKPRTCFLWTSKATAVIA